MEVSAFEGGKTFLTHSMREKMDRRGSGQLFPVGPYFAFFKGLHQVMFRLH